MAYQLVYDYKSKGFVITFFGDVSNEEANKCNGEIQGHFDFDNHRYQIVDCRLARLSNISTKDISEPAVTDFVASRTNKHVKMAIVASDAYALELCREFANTSKKMGSPWDYKIFEDYNEALGWATHI